VGAGVNDGLAMERRARELLDPRVNEALRNQFANRTVQEVVAGQGGALPDDALDPTAELLSGGGGEPKTTSEVEADAEAQAADDGGEPGDTAASSLGDETDQREKLMNSVAQEVNAATLEDLGIEVVDVRVKQVDWPDQVRGRV
ncbi:MAG TPA: protease modulator HflC, partial [Alcanivorax sp.]|nr:protease modulator HflC [Alcanivorax sp.]